MQRSPPPFGIDESQSYTQHVSRGRRDPPFLVLYCFESWATVLADRIPSSYGWLTSIGELLPGFSSLGFHPRSLSLQVLLNDFMSLLWLAQVRDPFPHQRGLPLQRGRDLIAPCPKATLRWSQKKQKEKNPPHPLSLARRRRSTNSNLRPLS